MIEQPVSGCWKVWVTEVTKMPNDHGETVPFSILANLCTLFLSVVIIRYMSQVTYGNPQTSAVTVADFHESLCENSQTSIKVCAKICGSAVASLQNCLSGSAELSFGRPWIRLVGVLQTIFGKPQVIESAKSSSGVSKIVLWNHKSCVNRCAISFECSAATGSLIIKGSFRRYVRRFCRYPAMFPRIVCNDSAEDSQKSASCRAEVHGIPQAAT